MRVFKTISLIGIILLFLLFSRESGLFSTVKEIPYSDDKPIKTEDFKRFPDYFSGYKAAISTSFGYKADKNSNNISVNAFMYPFNSYAINPKSGQHTYLKHESYHFKITELFARKFKIWINCCNQMPEKRILDSVNFSLHNELRITQHTFDEVTHHGMDTVMQEQLFVTIDTLLKLTKAASLTKASGISTCTESDTAFLHLNPTIAYFYLKILTNESVRLQVTFDKQNRIQSEVIYKNNKPDGCYLDWYENGRLYHSIQYKNGARNGLSLTYSPEGDILEKYFYINNVLGKDN